MKKRFYRIVIQRSPTTVARADHPPAFIPLPQLFDTRAAAEDAMEKQMDDPEKAHLGFWSVMPEIRDIKEEAA